MQPMGTISIVPICDIPSGLALHSNDASFREKNQRAFSVDDVPVTSQNRRNQGDTAHPNCSMYSNFVL